MKPTRDELEWLLPKYRAMRDLRAEGDAAKAQGLTAFDEAAAADRKQRLRVLAAAYPGALREFDGLGAEAIEARRSAVERALAGAEPEPWMIVAIAFHGLTFALLDAKRAGDLHGSLADVWAELERMVGVPRAEAEALLFPR